MRPGSVVHAIGLGILGAAPFLIAGTLVMSVYVENAVPIGMLWRPLLIAGAIAALVQVPLIRVAGYAQGTVWASVAIAVLAGYWVLGGALVLALTVLTVGGGGVRAYRRASVVVAGVAWILFAVIIGRGWTNGAFDWTPLAGESVGFEAAHVGPNIHLLLLDGYPRADVLKRDGFDNATFLQAMQDIGFEVYDDSRSNYDRTAFTLISMLWLAHVEDVPALWEGVPPTVIGQTRQASRALLEAPLLRALESIGYTTRVSRAPIAHVPIGGTSIDATPTTANNFELVVLQRTPLAAVLEAVGFAGGQQRAHIQSSLETFASVPTDAVFSLTHVLAPHAPYVFSAEGGAADAPPCYPATCAFFDNDPAVLGWSQAENRRRFQEHLTALNRLVVSAASDLRSRDPDAVIIVFSDHGAGWIEGGETPWANLLMVASPGHDQVLGDLPSLINVLPMVLNGYLGTNLSLQADSIFRSGDDPWLDVDEVGGMNRPLVLNMPDSGPVSLGEFE